MRIWLTSAMAALALGIVFTSTADAQRFGYGWRGGGFGYRGLGWRGGWGGYRGWGYGRGLGYGAAAAGIGFATGAALASGYGYGYGYGYPYGGYGYAPVTDAYDGSLYGYDGCGW
jgi:hypothetical protein